MPHTLNRAPFGQLKTIFCSPSSFSASKCSRQPIRFTSLGVSQRRASSLNPALCTTHPIRAFDFFSVWKLEADVPFGAECARTPFPLNYHATYKHAAWLALARRGEQKIPLPRWMISTFHRVECMHACLYQCMCSDFEHPTKWNRLKLKETNKQKIFLSSASLPSACCNRCLRAMRGERRNVVTRPFS